MSARLARHAVEMKRTNSSAVALRPAERRPAVSMTTAMIGDRNPERDTDAWALREEEPGRAVLGSG
jgi:hypothetical protein